MASSDLFDQAQDIGISIKKTQLSDEIARYEFHLDGRHLYTCFSQLEASIYLRGLIDGRNLACEVIGKYLN